MRKLILLVAVAGDAETVSAGGDHSCGENGNLQLFCRGTNSSGQLGNGTTTNSTLPVKVAGQP